MERIPKKFITAGLVEQLSQNRYSIVLIHGKSTVRIMK